MLSVGLAGCGGGSGGSVSVDGSSTVFPLTEAVAEEFMRANQGTRVNVGVSGTGGGFSKFLRGETAINNASRPISPDEIEKAEENGIEFIELPVAYDGVAVTVHPSNDWVDCLSVEELQEIWAPDSEVDNWNQVRDDFPDREIELYGPGTASGTYDYFSEAVNGEAGASRSDFTSSEDDNVLVRGIRGTETALGYFGLAYYENNAEELKVLGIDPDERGSGDSCVTPSAETVQDNSYRPLSRPLFVYVNTEKLDETTEAFLNFYVENAGELAPDVGYVAMPDTAYRLVQQRFENRTSGTVFGDEDVETTGQRVEDVLRDAAAPDTTE
ncbi:MAG: PstS family phosphate ABC transporter substrate-binding protein [Salinivenus sp.]